MGINRDPLQLVLQRPQLGQGISQSLGAFAQMPLVSLEPGHLLGERGLGLGPSLVRGIEITQLPLVLVVDVGAIDLLGCRLSRRRRRGSSKRKGGERKGE